MKFGIETIDGGIKKISLDGRLDVEGTNGVELRFTSHSATEKAGIMVDMEKVEFVGSIGMRLLLLCAKAQKKRGGMLVLCNLAPLVEKALIDSGIDSLIPMYGDEAAAIESLKASL